MFGKNIVLKAVHTKGQGTEEEVSGQSLKVNSIFGTIQGEGPYAGRPAIFIRLAGCNLRCSFCDTEFEQFKSMTIPEILVAVAVERSKCKTDLIVLTGGEPMRQQIVPLLYWLRDSGYHIQIETAGTLWPPAMGVPIPKSPGVIPQTMTVSLEHLLSWGGPGVSIVCSPKTPRVHEMIERHCQHFKYIIKAGEVSPSDGLPITSTQVPGNKTMLYRPSPDQFRAKVWVQPMDEYTEESMQPGWPGGDFEHDLVKTKANRQQCVEVAEKYGYRISLQQHKILGVE